MAANINKIINHVKSGNHEKQCIRNKEPVGERSG
jgi:hypothetical protein